MKPEHESGPISNPWILSITQAATMLGFHLGLRAFLM